MEAKEKIDVESNEDIIATLKKYSVLQSDSVEDIGGEVAPMVDVELPCNAGHLEASSNSSETISQDNTLPGCSFDSLKDLNARISHCHSKKVIKHALRQQAKRRRKNTMSSGTSTSLPRIIVKSIAPQHEAIDLLDNGPTKKKSVPATMREVLASIPGFSIKPRKRSNKKLSAAAQLEQTKEGCIDLETPDSILVNTNLRELLNKHTFSSLPPLYQYKLVQLLPDVDRGVVTGQAETPVRLSTSGLNNEFFARACLEWRERLAEGEFTPENRQKLKAEAEKEMSRLDPWKLKHFEPIWGERNSSFVDTKPLVLSPPARPSLKTTIKLRPTSWRGEEPRRLRTVGAVTRAVASYRVTVEEEEGEEAVVVAEKRPLDESELQERKCKMLKDTELEESIEMDETDTEDIGCLNIVEDSEIKCEPSPSETSEISEKYPQDIEQDTSSTQEISVESCEMKEIDLKDEEVQLDLLLDQNISECDPQLTEVDEVKSEVSEVFQELEDSLPQDISGANDVLNEAEDISDVNESLNNAEDISDVNESLNNAEDISDVNESLNNADDISDVNDGLNDAEDIIDVNDVLNNAEDISDVNEGLNDAEDISDANVCVNDGEDISDANGCLNDTENIVYESSMVHEADVIHESAMLDSSCMLVCSAGPTCDDDNLDVASPSTPEDCSLGDRELVINMDENVEEDPEEMVAQDEDCSWEVVDCSTEKILPDLSEEGTDDLGVDLAEELPGNLTEDMPEEGTTEGDVKVIPMQAELEVRLEEGSFLVAAEDAISLDWPYAVKMESVVVSEEGTEEDTQHQTQYQEYSTGQAVKLELEVTLTPEGASNAEGQVTSTEGCDAAVSSPSIMAKTTMTTVIPPTTIVCLPSVVSSPNLANNQTQLVASCMGMLPCSSVASNMTSSSVVPYLSLSTNTPMRALQTSQLAKPPVKTKTVKDSSQTQPTSGRSSRSSSNKNPPGAVNLERSYQICQAVIQNSPNRDQLQCQLKPPPALLAANAGPSVPSGKKSETRAPTQYGVVTSSRNKGFTPPLIPGSPTLGVKPGGKVTSSRVGGAFQQQRQPSPPVVLRHVFTSAQGIPVTMAVLPHAQSQPPPTPEMVESAGAQHMGQYILVHRTGAGDQQLVLNRKGGPPRASSAPPSNHRAFQPAMGRGRPASVDVEQEQFPVLCPSPGTQAISRRERDNGGLPPYGDVGYSGGDNILMEHYPATGQQSMYGRNPNSRLVPNSHITSQCACNLKAMIICQKCGAFCHDDCITPSRLCTTCFIR